MLRAAEKNDAEQHREGPPRLWERDLYNPPQQGLSRTPTLRCTLLSGRAESPFLRLGRGRLVHCRPRPS